MKIMTVQEFTDAGYLYIVNSVLHSVGVELTINIAADGKSVVGFGDINNYNGSGIQPKFNPTDPNVATKRTRAIALLQRAQEAQAQININL